jgi:hypothetical protein
VLILRRPWDSQPQDAVDLSGNSLGLVGAWVPTQGPRNLAGSSALFLPTSRVITAGGVAGAFQGQLSTESQLLTSNWSFLCAFTTGVPAASATTAVLGRGPTSGGNNTGFGFHAVHVSAPYAGAIYTGSGYEVIGKPTGGALANNTRYVIGAGKQGSSGAVYSDGIRTASASGLSASVNTGRLALGTDSSFADSWISPPAFEYFLVWNRQLTDDEFLSYSRNPWQLFEPRRIFIPAAAAGGTNASTTLTGAGTTAAPGALTAAGTATKTLTGAGTNASAGTLTATAASGATATLTGASTSSAVGTLTATGAATGALSGAGTTASAGTVLASVGTNATATLTGAAVSASVGLLSASGAAQIVMTGVQVTASAGTLTAVGVSSATATLTGASTTASAGTLTASAVVPGPGATAEEVWNYVLASGKTADETVSEIHAMLAALTAGSVVLPTDVKKVNGSTIYGTGIYPNDVFRSTP